MAFRFRRTMKIAPGVRLNLTKTGVSARVGPRGVGVTTGTSGTTVSAGLPGTGLHVSEKIRANRKVAPSTGATTQTSLGVRGWVTVALISAALLWGLLALLG